MPRYVMLIDSQKCMDCKACIVACQQRNAVPYGFARNWVRTTRDPARLSGAHFQPGACMHCDAPSCVRVCPTGATWKGKDGVVEIEPALCIGCGSCVEACPYHARFRHPATGIADKCDYCRQSTPDQPPACVSVCPVHCRVFGDALDPDSETVRLLASRKVVHVVPRSSKVKPSLAYLDATLPTELPPGKESSMPVASMRLLAGGLAWAGGLLLIALTGTGLLQAVRQSPKEDNPPDYPADKEEGT